MKFFYGSVFVKWLYLQKAMHRPCDLDLWPMNVIFFIELSTGTPHKYPVLISDRYLF